MLFTKFTSVTGFLVVERFVVKGLVVEVSAGFVFEPPIRPAVKTGALGEVFVKFGAVAPKLPEPPEEVFLL